MLAVSVGDCEVCCGDCIEVSRLVEPFEDCSIDEGLLVADDTVSVTMEVEVQEVIDGQGHKEVIKSSLILAISVLC